LLCTLKVSNLPRIEVNIEIPKISTAKQFVSRNRHLYCGWLPRPNYTDRIQTTYFGREITFRQMNFEAVKENQAG
jgi:hypothetical protein